MDDADDAPSGDGTGLPGLAAGGLPLRLALERHWWRTTRGRRWRALRHRIRHRRDPHQSAGHFLWWCYCAMGANLQMVSADIAEADDEALEAAIAAGCVALAAWLNATPQTLAAIVGRRMAGAPHAGLAAWLTPGRIPPEVAAAAGAHLAAVLTDQRNAGHATRALFTLGKRLRAHGAPEGGAG